MENESEARIERTTRDRSDPWGQLPAQRNPVQGGPCLGAADLGLALALLFASGTLYHLAFQARMYGDGPGLVTFLAEESGRGYHHVLYLPVLRLLRALIPVGGPLTAPELASVLGGSLGTAGTFLVARGLCAGRPAAIAGAVLAATAPAGLFFATCVEVYAVHLGAVAVCACVTLFGGWERPGRALFAAALFFPLLFWTHSIAALYGPGWVALAVYARSRRGAPPGWGRALLLVGPVLLAALLVAMVAATWYRTGELGFDVGREAEIVAEFEGAHSAAAFLRDGVVLPLGLLLPVALLGAWSLRREPLALAGPALVVLLPLAFLTWWGVPERGGYLVGLLPFLAALAARALDGVPRGGWRAAVWVLLAAQASLGVAFQRSWDRGLDPRARVALVRDEIGERGTVLSAHFSAPAIQVFLPRVTEISLLDAPLQDAIRTGLSPEVYADALLSARLFGERLEYGPLAVDLAHRELQGHRTIAAATPYVEALVSALEERYGAHLVDDPSWPLLVVPVAAAD